MAQSASVTLLRNVGAAGAGGSTTWPGGRGTFAATGTFGGTSVTLEVQTDGGVWLPVQAMSTGATFTTVALTAPGMFLFELPPCQIRAVATGGTPTGLNARADRTLVG